MKTNLLSLPFAFAHTCLLAVLLLTFAALLSSAAEFNSSSDIAIPSQGNATPFPSTITVSGVAGVVSAVQVKLNGLSHTYPADLDILLVAPSGQVCAVMTGAGSGYDVSNVNLVFGERAGLEIPVNSAITSGTYRASNYRAVQTLPPGGTGTIGTNLSALAAGGVNGDWKLFVNDVDNEDSGSIQSWSLVLVGPFPPHGYSPYGSLNTPLLSGQSVFFSAFVELGTSFQWKFQGTDLSGQTNVLVSAEGWSYLQLARENVQLSDAGIYTLVANNADGSFSLNFTLEVEPLTISRPYFYVPASFHYSTPYGQGVVSGTAFYLGTYVNSSVPVTYRWHRDGGDYPGTNSSLTFSNMSATDVGAYSVVASNIYGERTSAAITITLLQSLPLPDYPNDVLLTPLIGSDTFLRADLLWSVPNSFRWYFNGTAIAGATNSYLFLANLTTNQSGIYYATATNAFGIGRTSNFTVTVSTQAPVAYYYAQAASAYVEDSVELGRRSDLPPPIIQAGPPPAIQWHFQGTALPSATNATLQLSNLTLQQAGDYFVTATNLYGAVTQTVSLIVQPRRALDRWAAREAILNEDLYGIIFASGRFVAVGYEGTILTSSNGVNWTRQNSGSGRDLHALTFAGGQFVAVGKKGTVLTSPDAIVWTSRMTPTTNYLERIAYGNGIYVAVGTHNTILTSSNGINWTVRSNSLPPDVDMEGLAYGDGKFVAAGGYKHYVIYFNGDDGPRLDDSVVSVLLVSSNGVNWTDLGVDIGVHLRGVTYVNGSFLVVGNDGNALYSTNIANGFKPVGTPSGFNLRHATYGAGRFVAVGNYGSVYSAHLPGESLQAHAPVGLQNLHDVAYGLGKFVAVGNAGTIVQSAAPLPSFSAAGQNNGAFHFTLTGGAESNYTVQSSADFLSWTNVATFTNNGTGVSVTNSTDGPRRFYRAVNP